MPAFSVTQHAVRVARWVKINSTTPGNQYSEKNGTSMAAPPVAGVVALMLSSNPRRTDEVRGSITSAKPAGWV
ncbi:MAG TPA: S8 family serine peptidase [Trichocoleus sp.]